MFLFQETSLVSDGFVPAATIDPDLINPWGISFGPTSPFWVSDNGTGLGHALRTARASKIAARRSNVISRQPSGSGTSAPTGPGVQRHRRRLRLTNGGRAAVFIFATEDGTISGWNARSGTTAAIAVNNSAPRRGLQGPRHRQWRRRPLRRELPLRQASRSTIRHFALMKRSPTPTCRPATRRSTSQDIERPALRHLRACRTPPSTTTWPARARLRRRVRPQRQFREASDRPKRPSELALGPARSPHRNFGAFAGALLVGNFGDGTIGAYDATTAPSSACCETSISTRCISAICGRLTSATAARAATCDTVYFTAGIRRRGARPVRQHRGAQRPRARDWPGPARRARRPRRSSAAAAPDSRGEGSRPPVRATPAKPVPASPARCTCPRSAPPRSSPCPWRPCRACPVKLIDSV